MSDVAGSVIPSAVLISTTLISFLSGFGLGVYAIRGYLVPPNLADQRRRNLTDPVESDESDVEEDTLLDHAPNWTNSEDADRRQGLRASPANSNGKKQAVDETNETEVGVSDGTATPDAQLNDLDEECKLVLVVRTDLGMTKGKMAAQCGHATLGCYKSLLRASQQNPRGVAARLLARWERYGQAKIAVQARGQDELTALRMKAHVLGVTAELVADAGRTQIEAGSLTVLGVGPAPRSVVDKVTGHLKLL